MISRKIGSLGWSDVPLNVFLYVVGSAGIGVFFASISLKSGVLSMVGIQIIAFCGLGVGVLRFLLILCSKRIYSFDSHLFVPSVDDSDDDFNVLIKDINEVKEGWFKYSLYGKSGVLCDVPKWRVSREFLILECEKINN
jgi:hypothetical protein